MPTTNRLIRHLRLCVSLALFFSLVDHALGQTGKHHDPPSEPGARVLPGKNPSANSIGVTYLGNCGFLVQVGGKKVLFDLEGPDESYSRLASEQAPFDGLDLVLISHAHGDHVDPARMVKSLSANGKLVLYTTTETRDVLKMAAASSFAAIEDRIIAVDPGDSGVSVKTIAGMNVEFLQFYHGSDAKLDSPPKVLGFVVEVDGKRIFHLSDVDFSNERNMKVLKSWALRNEKIDVLFSHWGLLIENPYTAREVLESVKRCIRPEQVVPMHVIPEMFTFEELAAKTKQNYARVHVFRTVMERAELK
jgi:L-ascorbate metabolism protein UlaG (beta-lactamase superfamily)